MTKELKQAAQQALEVLKSATSFMSKKARDQHPKTVARLERALTAAQPARDEEQKLAKYLADLADRLDSITEMPTDMLEAKRYLNEFAQVLKFSASLPTQPAAQATPEPSHAAKMLKADVAYVEQQMAAATPEPEWRDRLTVNLLRHGSGLTKNQIRALIDYAVDGIEPDAALFTATPEPVGEPFAWTSMGQIRFTPPTQDHDTYKPLYTHPAPGVPDGEPKLTQEELLEVAKHAWLMARTADSLQFYRTLLAAAAQAKGADHA